jgi:alkylation response protein AidB-like acyl-CoA dehydrogenase
VIDLLPDDEQQELVDAARTYLRNELPTSRLREIAASGAGYDPAAWEQQAKQGWWGLGLPADGGGVGYGPVEEALLHRELGRHLVPGPVLGTTLAAHLAHRAGATDLVAELVGGSRTATLAEVRPGEAAALVWRTGPLDLLLVVDAAADVARVVEAADVALSDDGASIDPAFGMARVPIEALGDERAAGPGADLAAHGTLLVAAALTGVAEAARDLGAAYARDRIQFGKPIGTFQAVKHRAADTAVRAEMAWSQVAVAALHRAAADPHAAFHASAAKVVAADAAVRNGRDTIQNHGGIGFTDEHDAHLFLKRGHVLDHVLGDPRHHLDIVLDGEA